MLGRVFRSRSTWSARMKAGDAGTFVNVPSSISIAHDFCLFGKDLFLFFAGFSVICGSGPTPLWVCRASVDT